MSKVYNTKIVGQVFKPIVTNITYKQLDELREKNLPINITNSIIISVPKIDDESFSETNTDIIINDENIEDIVGGASIWITDYSGNLYPITFPYNRIKSTFEAMQPYLKSLETKNIDSIDWRNKNQIINVYQGVIPNIDTFINIEYESHGSEQIVNVAKASSILIYNDPECFSPYNESGYWYNTLNTDGSARTYYIKGKYTDNTNNTDIVTKSYITCIIEPRLPEWVNVEYNYSIDTENSIITINIKADQAGSFKIVSNTDLTSILYVSFDNIYIPNTFVTFKFKNNTSNAVDGNFTYTFVPQDTQKYQSDEKTFVTEQIPKLKPKTPFYWYTGTVKPTSDDSPKDSLAPNGLKPVLGDGTARYPGWRFIGDSLDNISENNPVYNGGIYDQCININADFDMEDYYIALPIELGLYDSDGKNYSNDYLVEENVIIYGRQYNIYKDHDSDVLFVIY